MSYIKSIGNDNVEEYKKSGAKILAECEKIVNKTDKKIIIFKSESEKEDTVQGYAIEHSDENDNDKKTKKANTNNSTDNNDEQNPFSENSFLQNKTFKNFKNSGGMLNTAYKKIIKSNVEESQSDSDDSPDLNELVSSMEETTGEDENDIFTDFMETKYKKGFHINGGGYAYYENGKSSSTKSVDANVLGSYTDKDDKLSILYGGYLEYSNETEKNENDQNESAVQKNGGALLLAKYRTDKLTYAGGGNANFYDNSTSIYDIYAGVVHNSSGISASLKRRIQVVKKIDGEAEIENKTDVKINLLKPKEAGDFNNEIPEMPSPESTQESSSLVTSEQEEVRNIVSKNEQKGFSLDLDLSTSSGADEYGAVVKYTTLISKKDNEKQKISITPYLGVYDYHPETQEGIKIRTGIVGNLNMVTDSGVNVSASAIVDNKRIFQPGSHSQNTFMATLDTTISKNKLSGTVSSGYINSNSATKYLFVIGSLAYKIKSSSIGLKLGYQTLDTSSDKDNIFHAGLEYALTF